MTRMLKVFLAVLALLAGPARAVADDIGIGLAGFADWSPQLPLLDLMKLSRPWVGHGPDKWGAMKHEELREAGVFDAHGWPTRIPPELRAIGTLVLTGLPEDTAGATGRYVLRFEGQGVVELGGRARNIVVGENRIEFDYRTGGGSVFVNIVSTDPGQTGDYVRNITILRTDRLAAFEAGAVFNPDWVARLDGFDVLRFMDWMDTNNSSLARWEDRPEPDDVSYTARGAPVELMIRLANETGIDPWFNMPHLADDTFVRNFAETVRSELAPDRRAYVEFSNEVWNWAFGQARWAEEQGAERWGKKGTWVQYYAMRAVQVADIWAEVYGDAAEDRLVRVVATQTAWLGLEKDILAAPLWVAEDPGRAPPSTHFDAYAITGYFGGHLGKDDWPDRVRGWIVESRAAAESEAEAQGLAGQARADFVEMHRFDQAVARAAAHLAGGDGASKDTFDLARLVGETFPHHARAAQAAGLQLVAYEGGSHVVGIREAAGDEELTAFFIRLNYSAEMGALYGQLLDGWQTLGAGVFVAYYDIGAPNKWGSWGHLRHLGDSNPRWDALLAARNRETPE